MREGLISYDGLPIGSGGGHGLGRLSPEKAWRATSAFLTACTTGVYPRRPTLAINSVGEADPALTERLCESAVATIGIHPSPHERQNHGAALGTSLTWMLSSETLPAAVAWRESLGALPSNWLGGPAVLRIDFPCRLREQAHGEALPFQEASSYLGQAYDGYGTMLGESGCRLTLSSKSTLALLLFLPFESPNDAAWDYVSFLQDSLPFRFSTKHWKHWRLSKSRTSYVGRKIAPRGISGSAG